MDSLRNAIAEAIWRHVSAQDVPAAADRLGLAAGTAEEAFKSKRRYIKNRTLEMDEAALLTLARGVQSEYGDEDLADAIDARTAVAPPSQ